MTTGTGLRGAAADDRRRWPTSGRRRRSPTGSSGSRRSCGCRAAGPRGSARTSRPTRTRTSRCTCSTPTSGSWASGRWSPSATTSPRRTSGRWRPSGSAARRWRNWAFESAALDLALRAVGAAAARGARAVARAAAVRQLARARRAADVRPDRAAARGPPGAALQARRHARLVARADGRGRRDGRGRDRRLQGPLRASTPASSGALLAMYERAMELFPDALLEDAHDLPEVAALLSGRGRPHLLRRADPLRRRPRRGPAAPARGEHQALPRRRPALAARPLRRGGRAAA